MDLNSKNDSLVLSYLDQRKAIGVIGMALPFVLAIGKMLLVGGGIQPSISAYYYTIMRGVFVGSLWSIGVFLFSYRGYSKVDSIAGNLACLFAVATSLFPTNPPGIPTTSQSIIGILHAIFALGLFSTLAFFCLALFRKTNPNQTPTPEKLQRNNVYTACGYTMIVSIALIIILGFMPHDLSIFKISPVFWLEALAIVSFGISWFVKGEAILKDK